ncbi:hypothetical protein ACFLZX_02915 [Nanoarchaeota archaeon]
MKLITPTIMNNRICNGRPPAVVRFSTVNGRPSCITDATWSASTKTLANPKNHTPGNCIILPSKCFPLTIFNTPK